MSLGPCQCRTGRPLVPGEVESPRDRGDTTRDIDGARTEREWYGWQFLIVDGVSLALAVSTIGTGSVVQFGVASGGFSFGAPIVHWAHGHLGRGFASLGLRLGLPITAIGITLVAGRGYSSLLVGAVLVPTSIAAAITIDAAVLAYDSAPNARAPRGLAWAPTLDLRAEGVAVGVAGSF